VAPELPGARPSARAPARRRLGAASWEALGTRVALRTTDPRRLAPARIEVERELAAIDRACSRFREDSELSRANARAGRPVSISPLLGAALAVALRGAALTEGDVDPTVGRALELAGYDRDWRELTPPTGAEAPLPLTESPRPLTGAPVPLTEAPLPLTLTARVRAGWLAVRLDRANGTLRVPRPIRLDLGATAKAWAADRAAAAAARAGGCGALVSVGGDVATAGRAPAGGWRVHVTDDHRSDATAPGQTIRIDSGGLATSSTAVRRWSHGGNAMHHIIDPATGAPVARTWRTVSVAAGDCTDANIATTGALVRAGDAPAWLARLGVPARLTTWGGRVITVGEWPAEHVAETRSR